jgi:hypothetical protein
MVLGSGIRDPRSGIRDPEKTYFGSQIQGSKRHRILDPRSGSKTLIPSISHESKKEYLACVPFYQQC